MAKKTENFLDYVPKRNSLFGWDKNDKGNVEIIIYNKGLFNRIAQLVFRKPKKSRIELEDMGTFIWETMDGEMTVYEIGQRVKEQFGEKAEPLYERLSTYIKILHENKFVVYMNKIKKR
ncbi:MAG: PqqD family protein [Lachnospiraceae bacterium]|nr:PqqD family protein [Lachnospiraceae bacterium]